ncbi:hypothetical protein SGFS_099100 [Streptomyces graminofaciens]|jgi:hypothetical protein|uniref:Uncharacterized protein n=1 Tax=Streptomyces graminofaciens TaxID=68212 RepID=A0ABM7FQW2_9ACTN|nr:hypothetical protein SGFS_099100 [Streptomyces graminofaciens]
MRGEVPLKHLQIETNARANSTGPQASVATRTVPSRPHRFCKGGKLRIAPTVLLRDSRDLSLPCTEAYLSVQEGRPLFVSRGDPADGPGVQQGLCGA